MQITVTTWMVTAAIVLVRLVGFASFTPVLSSRSVSWRVRFFLCIVIAMAVSVRVKPVSGLPGEFVGQAILLGGEFAIGAVIGFCARIVLSGIELAALQISQQTGISLGELYNPIHPEAGGALRQFYYVLALVIFLGVGGMEKLLSVIFRTFEIIPAGGFFKTASVLSVFTGLLGLSFMMALKVAAPVIIALLIATLAMGMLQRMVPQINILTVGFPLRMILGFIMMAVALAVFSGVVEVGIERLIEAVGLIE